MIIIIDGINAPHLQSLLKQTYALRARVFKDRLGWDVCVENGMETDVYDTLNPSTLVCIDDDGVVVGSMRILQTTGPNMLADVFSSILQGEAAPRSPHIWEATRFCVDTNRLTGAARSRNSISYVTAEIMVAACEYAMAAGVTDAVAVIDPIMNRVMKRSGNAPYDYLGKATPMGKVTAMAGLLDCSEERRDRLRAFAGITGDVIMPEDEVMARFADAPAAAPAALGSVEIDAQGHDLTSALDAEAARDAARALRAYCRDLLDDAETTAEMRSALRLIAQLERNVMT